MNKSTLASGQTVWEYANFVESRAKNMGSTTENLLHAAVGISGEAGEVIDICKKMWVYEQALDVKKADHIMEECGDILFYIQMVCNVFHITLDELLKMNMEKLTKRYPNGYSNEAAAARADKNPADDDRAY